MNVSFFDTRVKKFVNELDEQTYAKTLRTIEYLERFGNQLGMPDSKKVGRNLYELRIFGRIAVRLFYTFHSGQAIVLHGYLKKTTKIPAREFEIAERKLQALRRI